MTTAAAESAGELVAAFLRRPRYEVFPLDGVAESVAAHVPRDVKVAVTCSPRRGLEATLALSEDLARLGFEVAPHIAARLVVDEAHLGELLARLRALGARDALVIGGDVDQPAGRFAAAAPLLAAMDRLGHGLETIGVAGYPESHPLIGDEEATRALHAKEPFASYVVSQLCFDPATIAAWIARLRARGLELPVVVGMPGRVPKTKLLRIATRIGVGESARFLRRHANPLVRMVLPGGYSPDALVAGLASSLRRAAVEIAGFHLYTFNEVERTERWRRERLRRLAA